MAINLSFFRKTPHRVFHYEYRYYDPKKEAMEERLARLNEKEMVKNGKYVPGRYIRTHMRKNFHGNRSDSGKTLLLRIVILASLAILIIAAYYLADGFAFLLTPSR
ncbi:MAG: hypothetical protein PHP30_09770 [Bacteroidales bacterium]|nr:hypothetical protein [Bacteroidales bacterium]MDD2426235.1 hypothetical protein [Bacteroidales bacterium]MDD3990364.1 hypothetical protein [Bacteroidales bacterium]